MKAFRLRPGVHYAPVEGGVYFSSARATFVMRGPARLFPVVDICVPLLEDGTDVEGLVEAIGSPAARPLVDHLVKTFDERGLILHLSSLVVPEPGPVERERFPEALAYLETFRDDPYADFRRIRKARVLLAGPPEALGPAARGLVRAGLGQVLVATAEPDRLAGLASRHPEVRLLMSEDGGIPILATRNRPQAAVIFTEDNFPADALRRLPASCVAIPVRLGKDLAIVGPALGRGGDARGAERLWSRAALWSGLDGDDLLVRPSGDLLAGALAGQVALDALIGLHPGRVHLIHGPDLNSDSITPSLTAESEYDPPVELRGRALAAAHAGPDRPDWLAPLSGRWSGLFRVTAPGDLPQLPLALTVADGRNNCFEGRTVGFGPDQAASTVEAGLDALRYHCAGLQRYRRRHSHQPTAAGEGDQPSVAAAGLDEIGWLLDGALRLSAGLTTEGVSQHPERLVDWMGIDDDEVRRLGRALADHERTPVQLGCRQVPDFAWTLVSVYERQGGVLLARGWGPTPAVGAVAALSAAIARQQVRRTIDPGYQGPDTRPGYLHHLHRPHRDQLAAEVTTWLAARAGHLHGQRLRSDPTTGSLAVWCGTVWLDG